MSVRVCLCVCVSVFVCPQAYLPNHKRILLNFYACCLSPWLGPVPARKRNPKGSGNFLGFLPIDNALYSIAFRTHTKTAKSIEIPFGSVTRMGPKYHVLDGGPDPPRKGTILGVVLAIQKHRQSLLQPSLQLRCRVRCSRDHSIVNRVMQQTGSFSMLGKR